MWEIKKGLIYHQAVEKLMNQKTQGAGKHITQVVHELHIHHHGFVTIDECTIIAHKAYHINNLIEELWKQKKGNYNKI